jgi:SdrD B-like domain/FlgD Ig-like domain
VAGAGTFAGPASGTSTISGAVFYDANRNGAMDAGEQPVSGARVYLVDAAANADVTNMLTDASGRYSFPNLADGSYRVDCDAGLDTNAWVPTTTGTLYGNVSLTLSGPATADFGWRQIERSTTTGSPISLYVGANGLRVESYDDAVSAKDIYDDLVKGALVEPEAQYVTIRFDLGSQSVTSASVSESNGHYGGYHAASYVTYASWYGQGDDVLFHEYGHAWSWYYAYMVQQDPNFTGYLKARGLAGDSRIDSAYQWQPAELIAEDYRQLFGTANAASYPQMNRQILAAAQVAGLKDYLQSTFTKPPATSDPAPAPPPPLAVTDLAIAPVPVSKSGTVGFALSVPASTTVAILNSGGSVVRTLVANTSEPSGLTSLVWDRKNSSGQRVKSGTYKAQVKATDSSGTSIVANVSFNVS